jgi:O-acetyl-ADP-ribose deacetylase (regulator of RNase III)
MIFEEKQMDLFDLPHGWWLAHCISAELVLGAGIAVEFEKRYDMSKKLTNYCEKMYDAVKPESGVCIPVGNVYNLITKTKHWHKPTYDSFRDALEDMRDTAEFDGVTQIGMPRIGCGLDRLDWDVVKDIIQEVFEDTDMHIIVCYL